MGRRTLLGLSAVALLFRAGGSFAAARRALRGSIANAGGFSRSGIAVCGSSVAEQNLQGPDSLRSLPVNDGPFGTSRQLKYRQRDDDDDHRDEDHRLTARHAPQVRRLYVDGPAAEFVSPVPPVVNDQDSATRAACRRHQPLSSHWVGTPSCYRLQVCTSMVTTTAARTKTTTMASASKDPIALISVRPSHVPLGKSSSHRRHRLAACARLLIPQEQT